MSASRKTVAKPAPGTLAIVATAEQVKEAVAPISAIIEEKWPLGFDTTYWLGKLLAKLLSESKAIENGRQALLRQFAERDGDQMRVNEMGHAVFAPGEYPKFQRAWEAARAKDIEITGVRPLRASEIPEDTLKRLRENQINAAPLGLLSGSPFFIEDVELFGE